MHYGAWTPYLDEPNMLDWYVLSEELQEAWEVYVPDGTELTPLDEEQYSVVHAAAVRYADESVAGYTVPYHGPEHFRVTEERGMAAVAKLEELRGERFPRAVTQNMALALRLHDCHHCGSTFRADCRTPERLWWPELPLTVAAEWVSAQAASDFAASAGLPIPARLFQTMVIWASTFGGQTPRGQQLGIPNLQPVGLWGRIMRAADVCPPADCFKWLRSGIAVNYGEIPAAPPATTWDGYLQSQLGFAGYIAHCFDKLDEVAQVQLTAALGWRDRLAGHVARVEAMKAGEEPVLEAAVLTELAGYQVALL